MNVPLASWQPRRATRSSADALVGGVAAGLAQHLAIPVVWLRLAFVVSVALYGQGLILYAALWIFLPSDARFFIDTPGAEAASRHGKRPGRVARLRDSGPVIAFGVLTVGVLLGIQNSLGVGVSFFPLVFALAGLALFWRQADESQRERWDNQSGPSSLLATLFGRGGWGYLRVFCGLLLILAGLLASGPVPTPLMGQALVFVVLLVLGLMLAFGPILMRLVSDYNAERSERIRSQERADMAAHLHDSVLQTLALIQRNAHDPDAVARLARRQERELRHWLYTEVDATDATVMSALREQAARVEDERGVVVDVVSVGDTPLAESLRPLVAAAGEAITNSAKHAGTGRVDVYAEVTADEVEVFVRDRGSGFDLDEVPDDRHGVRDSIVGRMQRHGGKASVDSTPGEGTNVRLRMPRPPVDATAPADS